MKFIHLLPISRFVGFKFWNDRYFYQFVQRYSHVGSNISALECIPTNYARLLEECTKTKSLSEGKRLQAHMIMSGFNPSIYTTNRLCNLYVKCGKLKDARQVFDEMPERDVFSWARMIAGYARNGYFEDSLRLFEEMPERTVVAWNAIIAGYAQYGHAREALEFFSEFQHAGMKPDRITASSVLSLCSSLESLHYGKQVHAHSIKAGFDSDVFVGCALIDVYAKCESIEDARQVFDKMCERNVVSWNAITAGYARCGMMEDARQMFENMPERDMVSWTAVISGYAQCECGKEALELFTEMRKVDIGIDQVTLASVLSSCAILTAVEQGKQGMRDVEA